MNQRLKAVGVTLALIGLGFMIAGGVAFSRVQQGYDSLRAFSAAQDVNLSYNDAGELVDRGTTEGAEAIMTLLTDEWGYPIDSGDFDPDDPLVNTASEYMFQMATIGYHVLNGSQTVVLDADVEVDGGVLAAGTYDVPVDGRYWTGFDRTDPLEGPARSQAWSGTVHGLFAELGVGTVTASALQMGLAIAAILAGVGLLSTLAGVGLVWATRAAPIESTLTVGRTDPEMAGSLS